MILPERLGSFFSFRRNFILLLVFLLLFFLFINLGFFLGTGLGYRVSPALQKRTQKAGYKLVYQGDPGDTVGRTVMASVERKDYDGLNDWYGGDKAWWRTGKIYKIYGTGIFQGWEEIEDSEDQYLIVKEPRGRRKMKLRVGLSGDFFPDLTKLVIDNLDIKDDVETVYSTRGMHVDMGYVRDFGLDSLEIILKKGDVIAFAAKIKYEENLQGEKIMARGENDEFPLFKTDETGAPILSNLILRRFGGIEQIGEELGIPVDLYE